jgi:predicted enzyme related to lactoylglutathione lyase
MAVTKTAGVKTVLFPVKDMERAKALFRALMGDPQQDSPYYVGYEIDGQNIGLTPSADRKGAAGPVCYWQVDDIRASLQALLDAGAELVQDVRHVGGGREIASVKDAEGNEIGLTHDA